MAACSGHWGLSVGSPWAALGLLGPVSVWAGRLPCSSCPEPIPRTLLPFKLCLGPEWFPRKHRVGEEEEFFCPYTYGHGGLGILMVLYPQRIS